MVTKRRARRRLWWLLGTMVVLVAAIGAGVSGRTDSILDRVEPTGWQPAVPRTVGDDLAVATAASGPALANVTAQELLTSAPVVVVMPAGDIADLESATAVAESLRAPLLFAGTTSPAGATDGVLDLGAVLDALDPRFVVSIGDPEIPPTVVESATVVEPSEDRFGSLVDAASEAAGPEPGGVVLLRPDDPIAGAAQASIRAAGHDIVRLRTADPRTDQRAARRLARLDRPVTALVGSTSAWEEVDPATVRWQAGVARAGRQLPGGGQIMFPFRILVALYGVPGSDALGVLGEQDVDASIARARGLAEAHQRFSDVPVVPAFELIATVATGGPGDRGDYSRRVPRALVEEWVDAAGEAGVYVVLDLQPGRSSFLAQAKEWRDVLAQPHVGLALDAEWRLGPDEEPLEQIGSVGVDEVDAVSGWLADLTRNERLPQKLLLLHQFNLDMIRGRARLDTSRTEITMAIQMDGQGTQAAKLETWNQLRTVDPPSGVWWGWKNFYDEDPVVRTPRDTLGLSPVPLFVSYQ